MASNKPFPFQHPAMPSTHHGIVATSTSGLATVDLEIGHNNFTVALSLLGAGTDLADGLAWGWTYGSKPGSFTITVYKQDATFGPLIADDTARQFSFHALENDSVTSV